MGGNRACARSFEGSRRAQAEPAATGTVLQHSRELQIHRPQSPHTGPPELPMEGNLSTTWGELSTAQTAQKTSPGAKEPRA